MNYGDEDRVNLLLEVLDGIGLERRVQGRTRSGATSDAK